MGLCVVLKEHVRIKGPIQEYPDPNMKVAFFGDVGNGPSQGNVRVRRTTISHSRQLLSYSRCPHQSTTTARPTSASTKIIAR